MAILKQQLISEEIDTILARVLGKFLVQGSPTKHGGLRFLDIQSAKTFGFEKSQEHGDGNLLIISAPVGTDEGVEGRVLEAMKGGPHADHLESVKVRASSDPGKTRKMFVYVSYLIPTSELIADEAIRRYAETHPLTNTSEAVRRILSETIIPMAKDTMEFLITVIRKES